MDDLKLEIVYRATDEILPYANNAKIHGEEDVNAIMASIREFGFNDPIGIWRGIIVEGHGRLLAAKRLGMETVPTVSLDHLTDEQRRAYALAHNKTAELSGWDFNLQDSELADIANIDMTEFGFKDTGMEFAEFFGEGDGGGSAMNNGGRLRIVIGAFMMDVIEDQHDLYQISRNLDEAKVEAFISKALKNGDLSA